MRSRIKVLLDERQPVYDSVADITVDTDGRDPQDVADEVARQVEDGERASAQAGGRS